MALVSHTVQPFGSLRHVAPFQTIQTNRLHIAYQRRIVVRAGENVDGPPSDIESKEASLERLEAKIRGKAPPPRPSGPAGPARPIPIRGMPQTQRKMDSQYENMADWQEGKLFPEGWEKMDFGTRAKELYLGRRGALFWANKAAYASAFGLVGGWILFRFVGPALGLYKLAGDFTGPSL